jgi:hypothetical protein
VAGRKATKVSDGSIKASKLGEIWSEQRNNVPDEIKKLLERYDQRFTLDNPRLVERYIKAEINIWVRLGIDGIDEKFVAIFQRGPIGWRQVDGEVGNRNRIPESLPHHLGHLRPDVKTLILSGDGNQQTMLVDVVKFVEHPELVPLPTLVWFDSAQRINRLLPHALYYSRKSGPVFVGASLNQKTDVVHACWISACSDHEQLIGQVVEGAANIVDGIASNERERIWERPNIGNAINQLTRLRIALGKNHIAIGFVKGEDTVLQIDDVLVGPLNFGLNGSEPIVGSHA